MGVVGGRQPGADVEELADGFLAGQVPDRPAQNARSARAWATMLGSIAATLSPACRSTA
jgi:hypothetical protein